MKNSLHKASIIKKTLEVGSSTMLSRILGLAREVLLFRFLKYRAVADAFFTAYKIPNSLRKMFAEGALSAAMVPTLVSSLRKEGKKSVSSLISLAFIVFEGIVFFICLFILWKAEAVLGFIVPGFTLEQIEDTARWLRILIPFIFFLSSSALFAGALQSVHSFFIPAIAPALLNIVFVASIGLCLFFSWPVEYLCIFILLGGFLQFILHLIAYFKLGFSFGQIDRKTRQVFLAVLRKFLPCFFSMSVVEVSLFIDTSFASYLHEGSIALIHLSNRLMGLPLGMFAVAFSTILLPHFSRVRIYAPSRINFYILEAAKFVFWVTIPIVLVMMFFSTNILYTFFSFTERFGMDQVYEGSSILNAFLFGLFFFSLNKILLNVYYSFHNTFIPTIISIIATATNFILNIILMKLLMATGIALATSISAVLQTILFLSLMYLLFDVKFYTARFLQFLFYFLRQLIAIFSPLWILYHLIKLLIAKCPQPVAKLLLSSLGFWLWVGPLVAISFGLIYYTRKWFKVKVYFLD